MARRTMVWAVAAGSLAFLAAAPARAVYISEDIGGPAAGSTSPANAQPPGPVGITASGSDIWDPYDQFRYWHDTWNGDFFAAVRIVSLVGGTDAWRKFGIMARDGTAQGAVQSFSAATPQGLAVQWRDTTNGGSGWAGSFVPSAPTAPGSGGTPYWIAQRRVGNTFTTLWAPDVGGHPGTWSTPRAADIHTHATMPAGVQIGLAATAHNGGQFTTGTADHFSVSLLGTPQGRLLAYDGSNIGGAAFARLTDNSVVAPDHWKLERLYYVPGVTSQWYLGYNAGSTAQFQALATSGLAHQDYIIPRIDWSNQGAGSPYPNGYPTQTPFTGDMGNYTTRCFGQVLVPADPSNPAAPRTVTFREQNDDWAVMTVDGALTAINDGTWTNFVGQGGDGGNNATLTLTPGWHNFEFFQSEGGGGDNSRLMWNFDVNTRLFGSSFVTVDSQYLRTIDPALTQILTQGYGQVGDGTHNGTFLNIGSMPGEDIFAQLTVDFQGGSFTTPIAEFLGVPEPATCLLLACGLAALARRRRR